MKRETARHLEAFEYYYTLGDARSYQKVADKFGVTNAAVANWSRSFQWMRRVTEREHHVALKIARDNDKQIYEDKRAYRQIIKATIAKYADKLKAGKSEDPSIKDLIQLMEMDLKLMDRLDNGLYGTLETKEVNVSSSTSDTLNKLIDEMGRLDEPMSEPEEDDDVDFEGGGEGA